MVGYDEGFGGLLGGFGEFFGSTDVLGDFFEFGWDFESHDDMRMDGWMDGWMDGVQWLDE